MSSATHELSAIPSTYANSVIQVYDDLILRIKYNLGWPVIDVELCDDQIINYINQAVEFYTQFAGYTEEFVAFSSTAYPIGRGIHLPTVIESIHQTYQGNSTALSALSADFIDSDLRNDFRRVLNVFSFDPAEYTGTDALFSLEYVYAQQAYFSTMLGGFGFDLVTWETLKQFLDLRKKMFGSIPRIIFDVRTQRMRIIPEPTPNAQYIGVVGCYLERPVADNIKERWVQQYALALTKIALGHIRTKFNGISLFGGGQINGTDVLSQGLNEKQLLEDELLKTWGGGGQPAMFFLG